MDDNCLDLAMPIGKDGKSATGMRRSGSILTMTACPAIESSLDLSLLTTLARLLSPERLLELLDRLEHRLLALPTAVAALPEGQDNLVAVVHQSQGSAGSLGLTGVMIALRELEAAIVQETAQDRAWRGDNPAHVELCLKKALGAFRFGREALLATLSRH